MQDSSARRYSRAMSKRAKQIAIAVLVLASPWIATIHSPAAGREQRSTAQARQAEEPAWGEPELLMTLAWGNLNRQKPDLQAAQKYANQALALVPYWRYVRDILLPQIREEIAKTLAGVGRFAGAVQEDTQRK